MMNGVVPVRKDELVTGPEVKSPAGVDDLLDWSPMSVHFSNSKADITPRNKVADRTSRVALFGYWAGMTVAGLVVLVKVLEIVFGVPGFAMGVKLTVMSLMLLVTIVPGMVAMCMLAFLPAARRRGRVFVKSVIHTALYPILFLNLVVIAVLFSSNIT